LNLEMELRLRNYQALFENITEKLY